MQLLDKLKKVKFNLYNQDVFFNENGDFDSCYGLIMWEKDGNKRRFQRIGTYNILNEEISLGTKNLTWLSTTHNKVRHASNRCLEPFYVKKDIKPHQSNWKETIQKCTVCTISDSRLIALELCRFAKDSFLMRDEIGNLHAAIHTYKLTYGTTHCMV